MENALQSDWDFWTQVKGLLDGGFTVGFVSRNQPFHHGIPHMSESVTFLLGKSVYLEECSNPMLGGSGHLWVNILGATQ